MSLKKLLITSLVSSTILGTGISYAMPNPDKPMVAVKPNPTAHHMISKEQIKIVQPIIHDTREKIRPLRQKIRILKMQLNGKMVTQGATWDDLSSLTQEISRLNGEIFALKTKARYDIFKKSGIVFPTKNYRHSYQPHPTFQQRIRY